VNGAFECGLQLIKVAAIREMKAGNVEERVLDDVEGWSPPPCLLDVERLSMELEKAALDTAYERYFDWHSTLKNKLPYAAQGASQTSQVCLSRRVSTALNFMLSSNSVTAPRIKGEQDLAAQFFFLPYNGCLCMYLSLHFIMSPPSLPMQA